MKQLFMIFVLSFICCASALGQFGKLKDKVDKMGQAKAVMHVIQYNKVLNLPDSTVNTLLLDMSASKEDTAAYSNKALKYEIKRFLIKSKVECPAPQRRISKYVWMCGNGVKIRTNSARIADMIETLAVEAGQ